jgi:hypothetical protein
MKIIIAFLVLLALLYQGARSQTSTDVYICFSPNAKKYHYSSGCRGLNACKAKIVKITFETARNKGLALCGWED